jgi:hypothetical protein
LIRVLIRLIRVLIRLIRVLIRLARYHRSASSVNPSLTFTIARFVVRTGDSWFSAYARSYISLAFAKSFNSVCRSTA